MQDDQHRNEYVDDPMDQEDEVSRQRESSPAPKGSPGFLSQAYSAITMVALATGLMMLWSSASVISPTGKNAFEVGEQDFAQPLMEVQPLPPADAPNRQTVELQNGAARWMALERKSVEQFEMSFDYDNLRLELQNLYREGAFVSGASGNFGVLRDESKLAEAERMWVRIRGKKLFFEEATIRAYATRFADLMEREKSLLPAEREELLRLVELSKQPIHSLQPETSWNDMEWCRYIFAVVSGKEWPTKAYYPKTR